MDPRKHTEGVGKERMKKGRAPTKHCERTEHLYRAQSCRGPSASLCKTQLKIVPWGWGSAGVYLFTNSGSPCVKDCSWIVTFHLRLSILPKLMYLQLENDLGQRKGKLCPSMWELFLGSLGDKSNGFWWEPGSISHSHQIYQIRQVSCKVKALSFDRYPSLFLIFP